ncbi:MAG: methionine adenosyltransferase [Candidatus Bathyarchaeota archaeon]|nr:MAG: methionine adenosyltransferase [Candidatus Bathyarchaeota archaeon]
MRAVNVEFLRQQSIEKTNIEIVERKGQGHPDYLIDGASEAVSQALCQYYDETFGVVLHHNVDKGLLVGGRANPYFGGGEIIEPINVIVAGRAITQVTKNDKLIQIPVGRIALEAIKGFLHANLRFLDTTRHVIGSYMIRQGSIDLIKNFEAMQDMPLANDTSFGVSYAPLSQTESLVIETERYLNSKRVKRTLPELGEDIKVMGLRKNKHVDLTIAGPLISSLTPDLDHYLSIKEEIMNRVATLADGIVEYPVTVHVNTADQPDKGNVYLTVTGTSAEQGDDGNTGRGNRVHGLITPCRPMSLEATAGKNPINHVGKIYNVLAVRLANQIYENVSDIDEVYVKILSQIGEPIDQPMVADIQLVMKRNSAMNDINAEIESLVNEQLAEIRSISVEIIQGKTMLF